MGIHQLSKVIGDLAEAGVKENEIKNYFGTVFSEWQSRHWPARTNCTSANNLFTATTELYPGRKVAIDASMSIYQFLIAVRSEGQNLANEEGETTRHDPRRSLHAYSKQSSDGPVLPHHPYGLERHQDRVR